MIITTDEIFKNSSLKLKRLNKAMELDQAPVENVTGIVVRLGTNLTREILAPFKNLKFVATVTTGLDHIDLNYCTEKNIQVLSLKGETEFLNTITATPEHTWGLLLSLIRRIPEASNSVKNKKWNRDDFFGNELSSKNIGIIGLGRVGKIIAEYAKAFRMHISYYDPYVEESSSDFRKVSLDTLLKESDVITVHPPLNPSTEHLIKKEHFEKMHKRPFFLNTARGKIVCEDDLHWALENNLIKGAALDVLEHEISFVNKTPQSPLLEYMSQNDNLIITPHIAGSTYESMEKTALFIESKILKFYPGF